MKQIMISTLEKVMTNDESIVMLTADLGFMAFEGLAKQFPSRFINVGISEANMLEMAAGLSKSGHTVICYSMIPFIIHRVFEQIKIHLGTASNSIILIGVGSGYTYGAQGSSHHTLEDVSLMSSFSNINCYAPGSDIEMQYSIEESVISKKPSYIRVGWASTHLKYTYKCGNLNSILRGQENKNLIISYGSSLGCVAKGIENLPKHISCDLFSVLKFSPIDKEKLINVIAAYDKVLFIEPNIYQGSVSQLIEASLFKKKSKVNFLAINYPDEYFKFAGSKSFFEDLVSQSPIKVTKMAQEFFAGN